MNLRTRLAIAGGSIAAGAMVLVSVVLYPAVEANLRGQIDSSLVAAAGQAPDVAKAIKEKFRGTSNEGGLPSCSTGDREHPAANRAGPGQGRAIDAVRRPHSPRRRRRERNRRCLLP